MTVLRVRPQADRDTVAAADYLALEANVDIAIQFLGAVEDALERIAIHPLAGSLGRTRDARLSGVRYWPVPGFEHYLVFYLPTPAMIEVVRVLHGARDLDALLESDDERE